MSNKECVYLYRVSKKRMRWEYLRLTLDSVGKFHRLQVHDCDSTNEKWRLFCTYKRTNEEELRMEADQLIATYKRIGYSNADTIDCAHTFKRGDITEIRR